MNTKLTLGTYLTADTLAVEKLHRADADALFDKTCYIQDHSAININEKI